MNHELQINVGHEATILLTALYARVFGVILDPTAVWLGTVIFLYLAYRVIKKFAFIPTPLLYAFERLKQSLKTTQQLRLEAIQRGKAMSEQDRVLHLKKILADAITNGLEDAIHNGEAALEEVEGMYNHLAKELNLPDLLNKKLITVDAPAASKPEPVIVPEQPKPTEPQSSPTVGEVLSSAAKAAMDAQKIVRLPEQPKKEEAKNVSSIFKKVS